MIPQTSITNAPLFGLPGQHATLQSVQTAKVDTALNEEASAHIGFGTLVKRGTQERRMKLPSAKTDLLLGFVMFGQSYQRNVELDATGLTPGTHGSVCVCGTLWIMPEEDMAPGDHVHGRVTANVAKLPGMIGKTDDGVNTIDISGFCQVRSAGGPTSGQPIALWFDFSNVNLAVTDS
jgi:hypothetical protein